MYWKDDPATRYVKFQPRTVVVESDDNLNAARHWMEKCLDSHKGCDKPSRTFHPTRVVGIISDSIIRLHTPAQNDLVKWAALSYCWGGHQPL
jgi:hypothetical protein